jgi:hypothetical protein
MKRRCFPVALVVAFALSLGSVACGKGYAVATAPGFVKIDEDQPPYDWRAVAPEGVAVALRVVKLDEPADLPFWTQTVTLRMREMDGYSLITSADVRSLDGTAGKELVFGHDESGKPFVYRVRIFLAKKRLYVVEAGGAKEQMDRYAKSVDWMFASVKVG